MSCFMLVQHIFANHQSKPIFSELSISLNKKIYCFKESIPECK